MVEPARQRNTTADGVAAFLLIFLMFFLIFQLGMLGFEIKSI